MLTSDIYSLHANTSLGLSYTLKPKAIPKYEACLVLCTMAVNIDDLFRHSLVNRIKSETIVFLFEHTYIL